MGDLDSLIAERGRLEATLDECARTEAKLDAVAAKIAAKIDAVAGDAAALSRLKAESEQTAEAQRLNDHARAEASKRLREIESVIDSQRASDMS